MNKRIFPAALLAFAACFFSRGASASDADEFKVKREEVFAFEQAPSIRRDGDRVEIRFESKGYCDVTVAIETADGKIIRHLASGVLGHNAPAPFQKDSKAQTIVWDGKDDLGFYIDDKDAHTVRVSLGLKPQFDRNLWWEPMRRMGSWLGGTPFVNLPVPRMYAGPDGMYVFEGRAVDQLRLFDRDGNYLRTVYPFPADKVDNVIGVNTHTFPQDGQTLPRKIGFCQGTLLTSGSTAEKENREQSMCGAGALAIAVQGSRIALGFRTLNRLATDGSSGGLPLSGPSLTFPAQIGNGGNRKVSTDPCSPVSLAFSPDGKTLYATGYLYRDYWDQGGDFAFKDSLHGVVKLEYEKDAPPQPFAGSMKQGDSGSDDKHFTDPTSVDCDAQGRVYVSDFMNDRIQVFAPDGKLLKSIRVDKPAKVAIHRRSGEIYAFTWTIQSDTTLGQAAKKKDFDIQPKMTKFGPFDDPKKLAECALPLLPDHKRIDARVYHPTYKWNNRWGGLEYAVALDSWSEKPRVWICQNAAYSETYPWNFVRIYEERGGKLELVRDFGPEVHERQGKLALPAYWRQRLYADHKNNKLYLAEQHTAAREKCFREVVEIDPATAKNRVLQLPFDAEDMAVGPDGHFYLRERIWVARYDPANFREVPWDYGEEADKVSCDDSQRRRTTDLISALPVYCGTGWHLGGMTVSVKDHLGISCYVTKGDTPAPVAFRTDEKMVETGTNWSGSVVKESSRVVKGRVYSPKFYPGRMYFGEVHIFDRHGHPVRSDAVGGLPDIYGLGVDKDDAVYVMASPTRVLDGKRYNNEMTGTVMKFPVGRGRIVTTSRSPIVPIPITEGMGPKEPPTAIKGGTPFWVDGADWKYGGVGFCGKNATYAGGGCACYNSRFYLDYFGRSFAPELDRCQVAVLDTNGNLILRVGRYGNVDSAGPDSRVPLGGDEVGIVFAPYVATITDKRLFIADAGNQRIAGVKLGYHAEARTPLAKVPDKAGE
ncbi:MAG: hypothetical protein L6R28_11620 [Planctomycetes bacterium]|nr:hypothetical protein [Planctomycetota bacterium]